jgi:hypothetical protein
MSDVLRLLKLSEPCSLTTAAPGNVFGCHTQKAAPAGSAKIAIRPESPTSSGSISTVPPASRTLAAVSSASSTRT